MFKFHECCFNVPIHTENDFAFFVILLEGDFNILVGVHIHFYWVFHSDYFHQMIDIRSVNVLHTKIIDRTCCSCDEIELVGFWLVGKRIERVCFYYLYSRLFCVINFCIQIERRLCKSCYFVLYVYY